MYYQVSCTNSGSLASVVQCLETMNQFVRLDIDPSGLRVQSVDHDDTTLMTYTLPVLSIGGICVRSSINMRCDQILQFLLCTHGDIHIGIDSDPTIWSVRDSSGQSCLWSTGRQLPNHHDIPASISGYAVCIPSVDFLLYVQHISLCESYVRVSSHGTNDVTLSSDGELISIRIQNQPVVHDGTEIVVVQCTFKYIRAVLSIIQKSVKLDMFITDGTCVNINVPMATGTLSIILKDKTVH